MKCEKIGSTPYAPGTAVARTQESGSVFAQFAKMISMTDGLTLAQVCAITGLEPSSVQNWIKRGFVAHPVGKKYYGRQLARILLINALRDSMKIETVGLLMQAVNGDTEDESDDIISEEKFYDLLCAAFDRCEASLLSGADIRSEISSIVSGHSGSAEAKERLTDALCAMVYAYGSGILNKKANEFLNTLINGGKYDE